MMGIKKYANSNNVMDTNKNTNDTKLICDDVPSQTVIDEEYKSDDGNNEIIQQNIDTHKIIPVDLMGKVVTVNKDNNSLCEQVCSSQTETNQNKLNTVPIDNKTKEHQNGTKIENIENVITELSKSLKKEKEEACDSDGISMQYRTVHSDRSGGNSEGDSSGSSSSSSSDCETDNNEQDVPQSKIMTVKVEDDYEDDYDDDKRDRPVEGPPRTNGEITYENLPPIEDLTIKVDDSVVLQEVGHVSSIIGTLVIVQANRSLPALNEDSVLFLDGRKVLGQVFEVFGPVPSPLYSVRFNSIDDINEKNMTKDQPVFYAPEEEWLTNYVFVEQLRRMKGTDASWEHNNEPPDRFIDFSDDEEERKAKAKRRGRDIEANVEEDQKGNQGKKKRTRRREQPNKQATGQDWNRNQGGRGPYSTAPFNRNPFDHMHRGPLPVPDPCMSRGMGFPGNRGPAGGFRNRGPHPRPPRFGHFPVWGPRHGHPIQIPRGYPPGFMGPGPMYRNGPPEYHWHSDPYSNSPNYGQDMGNFITDNRSLAFPNVGSVEQNNQNYSKSVVDTRLMNNPG